MHEHLMLGLARHTSPFDGRMMDSAVRGSFEDIFDSLETLLEDVEELQKTILAILYGQPNRPGPTN